MLLALPVGALEVADRRGCGSTNRRRKSCGENKAGRVRSHRIDQRGVARNISAKTAERLGKCPLDDIDAVRCPLAFCDAAAARAIQADRMHLIAIGHRFVTLGKIANAVDRGDVTIHGIEALEHDQLRPLGLDPLEQLFEVAEIVVAPDMLLRPGLAHAFDHRVVVERVGQNHAPGH
jgi:hypothetical protein